MNNKHKIDVNEYATWKIDSECKNRSIPLTDDIDWSGEYRIDTEASCWSPPGPLHPGSLFEIQGLGDYDSSLIRTAILDRFIEVVPVFDRHLLLLPFSDLDEDCERILHEAPVRENVHILVTNEDKVNTTRLGNIRKRGFKALLRLAPSNIDEAIMLLDHVDWVLIEGNGLGECPDQVFSEFLEGCQKLEVDCWVTGGIIPDVEFEFDLPAMNDYVLFDNHIDYLSDVSELHVGIETARQAMDSSGLELAYRLNKLVNIAKSKGNKAFWQLNFEVGSFSEYCDSLVGITSNLGYQYLHAVKVCETLNPGYLEEVFENTPGVERLPIGYTRFRDIGKYLGPLKKLERNHPDRYEKVTEVLYNPACSNRDVTSAVKETLGVQPQVGKPKESRSGDFDSLMRSITNLGQRVKSKLPSDVHSELDSLIEKMHLLISNQISSLAEGSETEVVEPEYEDVDSIMAF